MKKCTIAVFHEAGREIELREVEIPRLKQGEILVKNEITTLCRSDLNTFSGKRKEKTPTILGHEIVGKIEQIGPGAIQTDERGSRISIGDRITWAIFSSDKNSELARMGIPQKGDHLFKYGHERLSEENTLNGGLGEYTILRPGTPVVKLDTGVPVKVAAIINCAVATAAGALRIGGDVKNKNVLISGTGMLGAVACAMCKSHGAGSVIAVDVDSSRLERMKNFGAALSLNARQDLKAELERNFDKTHPMDVILEFSGTAEAMESTLEFLKIGGMAVWLGAVFPQRKVQIDSEKLIRNLHTLTGLHNYNNQDLVTAVTFIEKYHTQYPFEGLISDDYSLREVNEAFIYALDQNPFRVGIHLNA